MFVRVLPSFDLSSLRLDKVEARTLARGLIQRREEQGHTRFNRIDAWQVIDLCYLQEKLRRAVDILTEFG